MTFLIQRCHFFNTFHFLFYQRKVCRYREHILLAWDVLGMQLVQQFGLNKSLDFTLQLIYTSTNLFSSFELDNGVGLITLDEKNNFSKHEKRRILTHFLNLVEYFSYERLHLIQDPIDSNRYALIGMPRGI